MRFLGIAGYYRKFCNNFSVIAEPLSNILSKQMRFKWTSDCQNAFDKLKAILWSGPVLMASNFNKASCRCKYWCRYVLLQEDDNDVDHPVCYLSKKFSKHQKNYSTVEKECLSLILALQHFEVLLLHSHLLLFSVITIL